MALLCLQRYHAVQFEAATLSYNILTPMGKSNKKAKSDRINALRKQYDAFLEEDKKRKERNDFILGRLDKMRYTAALVPVRNKPSAFDTRPAVVDRLGFQPEFSAVRDFQSPITNQRQLFPDIQVNNNEDTYLIQEISKKYILIPKFRTTFMNNNCIRNETTNQNPERLQEMHSDQDTVPTKDLKLSSHDNTDWKSKYEILNILKNEEKGKPTGNYQTGLVDLKQSVSKESSLGNNQDHVAINCDNYINTDVQVERPNKYMNEFPEKDVPTETIHYDLPKDGEYSLNNTVIASEDLVANADTSKNKNIFNVDQTDAVGDQLQNITLEYKHLQAPNIDMLREVTNYHEPQHEPDVNMTSAIADVCSKQIVHINEENVNINHEDTVEPSPLIQNLSVEQQGTADSEQVVDVDGNEITPMQAFNYSAPPLDVNDRIYENENSAIVIDDQEFAPNIDIQMKTDATVIPQEQTYPNNSIETAEEAEPVVENTENQLNITESIADFDNEQSEMFYSEQTDENYSTQQGDMEHPGEYSQNEYLQNQEYAYYENTAAAYPGESNDEGVTQQYDPSYEEQYTGLDQGSEQQQYAEQYQEPERFTDQIEPQFDVLEYEQQFESPGAIEESLDIEDGYTAPKSEALAMEMPPSEELIENDKSDDKTMPQVLTQPVINTSEQIMS